MLLPQGTQRDAARRSSCFEGLNWSGAKRIVMATVRTRSGQIAMAGWNNTGIEIFNPPYMYRGSRPAICSAASLVHHAQSFVIESPDADKIVKVVLVRPMAVTHQWDTEQKVLEMPYVHDHANPTRLTFTAPHGGHPIRWLTRATI